MGKREYAKIVDGYMSQSTAIETFQRTKSCHNLRIASSPVSEVAMLVPFALSKGLYPWLSVGVGAAVSPVEKRPREEEMSSLEPLDGLAKVEKVVGGVVVVVVVSGERSVLTGDEGGDGVTPMVDEFEQLVEEALAVVTGDVDVENSVVLGPTDEAEVVSEESDEDPLTCEDDGVVILEILLAIALDCGRDDVDAVSVGPRSLEGEPGEDEKERETEDADEDEISEVREVGTLEDVIADAVGSVLLLEGLGVNVGAVVVRFAETLEVKDSGERVLLVVPTAAEVVPGTVAVLEFWYGPGHPVL